MRTKTFPCMSAQESQTCMRIPKLCSLQGWNTIDTGGLFCPEFKLACVCPCWWQHLLEQKTDAAQVEGQGKELRLSVELVHTCRHIYLCKYAYRITFDYVCVGRNEIDPKGPCHIYIYIHTYIYIHIHTYIYIYTSIYIHVYLYLYIYIHMDMYIQQYTYTFWN